MSRNSNFGVVYKSSFALCAPCAPTEPTVDDVPQAFTHWTYEASRRKRMVCDLQGFFTGGRFVLVDPVIHSDGDGGGGAFGRTDRGQKGMADFLRSHECNALCRALALTPPTVESVPSRRICVICEDQPREVRFPCGHACTCDSCAHLVRAKDNLCPTCRAPLGDEPFEPVGMETTTYVRSKRVGGRA